MPSLKKWINWRVPVAGAVAAAGLLMFMGPPPANGVTRTLSFHVTDHVTGPSAPYHVGVRWSSRTGGTATATVQWHAPRFNGGATITGYSVSEGSKSCTPADMTLRVLSCQITSLRAGGTYTFVVTADNGVATSQTQVTASLNAQGQVISFDPLPNITYDHGPLALTATASSGLSVTYTASGACSVVGNVLSPTGVGGCAVIAFQDGSSQFQAASPVANYFQISVATALLAVTGGTFVATGSPISAVASDTPSVAGIVVTYCENIGPSAKSCSTQPPVSAGVFSVAVSLNNPNYVAAPVSTTLTITAPAVELPPGILGGPTSQGDVVGTTTFTPKGIRVDATGRGFTPGGTVDVGAVSQEALGSFTIPSSTGPAAWINLLRGSSTSTVIIGATSVNAADAAQVSFHGSVAYPYGGFNGPGTYEILELQSSGFIPGTAVTAILHSSPVALAQAAAGSNGVVTMFVPVPTALAGQTHSMYIAGTYLVTTTTTGPAGAASTSVTVAPSLLQRLTSNAPMLLVFDQTNNAALRSFNTISLPTAQAFYAYVHRLEAPKKTTPKAVKHPKSSMIKVTGAAAALSAAAAGVAAARMATGAAGASHAASAGSRGAEAAHRGNTDSLEAVHHAHVTERSHVGDRSFTWRAPGWRRLDELSVAVPVAMSRYSPLGAVMASDSNYWRAMFGSLSLLAWPLGLGLGVWSSVQTRGFPFPPHLSLFLVIIVLGFLDATAGLAAVLAVFFGAMVTNHLHSLDMVVSVLILATLWFGLPVMVKKVRPFVRPHPVSFQDWWVRGADFIVGAAFAGFLAAKLVVSFSLLAHFNVPLVLHANTIGWVVAGAAFARYAVTTFAVFIYPQRLRAVTPEHIHEQHESWLALSILVRIAIATMLVVALLGRTWFVPPIVALVAMGMWQRSHEHEAAFITWLHRLVPRNVPKILIYEIVGTVATIQLTRHVVSPYWQIAGLLFVIFTLGLIIDSLSAIRGREWPANWYTRLAGVGLFLLAVAQLSGNLIGE